MLSNTHHVHDQMSAKKTPVGRLLKARVLQRREEKDESATSPSAANEEDF